MGYKAFTKKNDKEVDDHPAFPDEGALWDEEVEEGFPPIASSAPKEVVEAVITILSWLKS